MSLIKRVGRGATAHLFASLFGQVAKGALIVLLAAYFLSPDEYGLLFFAISVLGIAIMFANLGFAKSGARYIAEYRETDPTQIPHIVRATLGFNVVSVLVVCVLLAVTHEFVAQFLNEPLLAPLLLVGTLYVAMRSFGTSVGLLFQGFNRIVLGAGITAFGSVALLGFVTGFLALGLGVTGALLGYTAGYLVTTVSGLGLIYLKLYRTYDEADTIEPGLSRRIAEYSIPLTATRGANTLDSQVDTVLVGYFLTTTDVAYYTLAKQIADFVIAPATSIGFAIAPNYGEQKAADRLTQAAHIYELSFRYTTAVYAPAAAGLIIVAEPAILFVFGSGFLGAVPVLQLFGLFVFIRAIDKITNDSLDYLGRARARAIAKGATATLNFALNLVLIPTLGVIGAAIATVFTYSIMVGVELVIVYRELPISVSRLARTMGRIGLITVGMSVVTVILATYISGVLSLIGVILVAIVVWFTLAMISGVIEFRKLHAALS